MSNQSEAKWLNLLDYDVTGHIVDYFCGLQNHTVDTKSTWVKSSSSGLGLLPKLVSNGLNSFSGNPEVVPSLSSKVNSQGVLKGKVSAKMSRTQRVKSVSKVLEKMSDSRISYIASMTNVQSAGNAVLQMKYAKKYYQHLC